MAKREATPYERLARVRALRDAPLSEDVRTQLRAAIEDASPLVVAEAAAIVRDLEPSGYHEVLLAAWSRFVGDRDQPVVSLKKKKGAEDVAFDKGCAAKTAIVEALSATGFDDPEFYLAGMKYRQMEPAWPKSEETAANVRGSCAYALARSHLLGTGQKLLAMVDLLNDASRAARAHAARAISDLGAETCAAVLKLKILLGDAEAEVMGACFVGLIRLAPNDGVPLVARYLAGDSEALTAEAAAALGEANRSDAVDALTAAYRRSEDREQRQMLLGSLGLSRHPQAVDFLIERVRDLSQDSEGALESLAPLRFYPDLRGRIQEVVRQTGNRRLQALFDEIMS